jgi:hypothetical protein
MLLNLIIIGSVLLIFYAVKGLFDVIQNMEQRINKLTRVTDLLHNRLLHVERLINDQVEAKKEYSQE